MPGSSSCSSAGVKFAGFDLYSIVISIQLLFRSV